MADLFRVVDLGRMRYDDAYALQREHVEEVLAARDAHAEPATPPIPGNGPEAGRVLLVEHDPPVITITRRPGARGHLLAAPEQLARAGIEVAETDRGGDVTYHGPGQLVVYPILDLNLLRLRLHDYMRLLEAAVIDACDSFGVRACRDACATGVWVGGGGTDLPSGAQDGAANGQCNGSGGDELRKICAMGVRVRRWVSMHGLALNVTTNLDHFGLIVPCGLTGRPVTSLERELGVRLPAMIQVKSRLMQCLESRLLEHLARSSEPAPS
jgi:lipoyl(octanoyl) transferase